MTTNIRWASALAAIVATGNAFGGITVAHGINNAAQWFGGVGNYNTLTFTEFPAETVITEQYAPMGVHFVPSPWGGGNFQIVSSGGNPSWFPQDGFGLKGIVNDWAWLDIVFDTPMLAWASHYPLTWRAEFYSGTQLVYGWEQSVWGPGNESGNMFTGFYGDIAFNRVRLQKPLGDYPGNGFPVLMDNMYFSTVPAPGAASCLLWLASIGTRRRRASRAQRLV